MLKLNTKNILRILYGIIKAALKPLFLMYIFVDIDGATIKP